MTARVPRSALDPRRLLPILTACLMPLQALAHTGGTSYVQIDNEARTTLAHIDLPLPELAIESDLDRDRDGLLRWSEVLDAQAAVIALLRDRLQLRSGQRACTAALAAPLQIAQRETGRHLRIVLRFDCGGALATSVDATQWLGALPNHGIYVSETQTPDRVALLAGSLSQLTLGSVGAATQTQTASALRFGVLGAEHLLSGYDHLAFLALLLLSTLRTGDRTGGLRQLFFSAAKVVTAFTAAHSLTLALAALGIVHLPSAWVEASIAASILFTALLLLASTLRPVHAPRSSWPLALGFGLVHGLGFANVLQELLTGAHLAQSLMAFNLGIEIAQLGLVLASLPLLWLLLRRPRLSRVAVPALTVFIGIWSTVWLMQRLA